MTTQGVTQAALGPSSQNAYHKQGLDGDPDTVTYGNGCDTFFVAFWAGICK